MDWQDAQICKCGHKRSYHDSDHSEVPTGTGHCLQCRCGRFDFSHQIATGPDDVALFDMDGSLADFDEAMISSLNALRSDDEEVVNPANLRILEAKYPWLQRRMLLIKSRSEERRVGKECK